MLTYDIFYTMLIVPTWLLFTSAELLEEEGRQHMSIWLYGWCLLCLLPNGLFAAAAGECLNKLSSELWFARNKASIFLIDQHSDYPHLSSRYFSGFRLAYALQLQLVISSILNFQLESGKNSEFPAGNFFQRRKFLSFEILFYEGIMLLNKILYF